MQRVRTSSWNHQQAWTLQLLNLLGVLSENKGNNVTGGALQALNLSGFTFRNQHLWNYGLIHLASLPSPNSCIILMPFSEGLKKISEREESNFLRIQKANSYIHLQKRNKITVESCLIILLTYNFCPVLLLCSPEKRKLSGQCRSQAHASHPTTAPVQTHAPCCTAASRPRVPARGQGCGDTMAPPHCPLPPSVTLAPGNTRQSTMAGILVPRQRSGPADSPPHRQAAAGAAQPEILALGTLCALEQICIAAKPETTARGLPDRVWTGLKDKGWAKRLRKQIISNSCISQNGFILLWENQSGGSYRCYML